MTEPTDAELAGILSHVRYEIEQCFIIPKHHEHDWHLRESIFLAILIHARVLLAFFESTDRRKDDVLCSDFGFPTSPVSIPRDDRKRFNKDIAHLTYSRLRHTPTTKPWPVAEILRPLLHRSVAFISYVISHPPGKADEQELSNWKALLELLDSNKTVAPQ
jgi:hypothetical protein